MPNKYLKNCSISLAIKEIKIKTTPIFHLTLDRITIIKKKLIIIAASAGEDVRKRNPYTLLEGL
jgi:hypothetical protein